MSEHENRDAPGSPAQALDRRARALRTLSRCNHLLVHAQDPTRFMHDVCSVIVEAGYRLAWIGMPSDGGTEVVPVARAGHDDGYVDEVRATVLDTARGAGPVGTAMRMAAPVVVRSVADDAGFAPWRAAALARGYGSVLALPLLRDSAAFGVIAIYAAEPDAFDADELQLLSEVAAVLAYGIQALEDRAARQAAQDRLQRLHAMLTGIRDVNQIITRERNPDVLVRKACEALVASRGCDLAMAVMVQGKRVAGSALAGDPRLVEPLRDQIQTGHVPVCLQRALAASGLVVTKAADGKCSGCPVADGCVGRSDAVSAALRGEARTFGAIHVLLPRGSAADPEELALLEEIVDDVSFALQAIETESHRNASVEQLRQSEERFRSLFECAVEGVALHELLRDRSGEAVDYRIVDANPAYERHTGIPVARARGAIASELYGSGRPPYLAEYARVASTGEPYRFEVYFGPLDKHFQITAVRFGHDRFATIFEDITRRKRDEETIRMNDARLAALYELSRRPFAGVQELVAFALEKAVELTGSEIGYFHFVEDDQVNLELFAWSSKAREGCTVSTERHYPLSEAGIWADCIRLRRPVVHNDYASEPSRKGLPDGHAPITRHMSTCVVDDGKVVVVAGVGNKATDYAEHDVRQLQLFLDGVWGIVSRKRIAEALAESAARWASTFDAIQDAVCVVSPSFDILEANVAACNVFGAARDAVVGRKCYDLIFGADAAARGCPCKTPLQGCGAASHVVERGGRSFDVTIWPIAHGGKHHGFVHVMRDLTEDLKKQRERQDLEEKLRMSQKLEAIGKLAGGIAHDFNNLLSVINSYSEFAMDGLRPGDPVRDDIAEILAAGQRAAELTRQLLAFSRKQVLRPVVLNLNDVVRGMEGMLRRLIGEDIVLQTVLAADLAWVKADPSQIEQVVMNIAVNARDAMPRGGKLTIESCNVHIDETYADAHVSVKVGPHVMLSFTDTGEGMDEQTRLRVFEPFFTTKGAGKGTGLGLSTVYGIVKQSGGNVWVYSEPGRGTTFKVYLPAVDEVGDTLRFLRPTAPRGGSESVLVVEDEEAVRKLARRILESAGYRVFTAASGVEALAFAESHQGPIDLVLTDVVMPGMSGRQVASRLLAIRPAIKVLYMSGYTDNAIVHHGVLDDGTNFIGKPFTAADLTRKVREVLDGKVAS